ncbi:hypothetical protein KP509_18G028900 [Ceratopteris richardii]|uniref:UspA domain-containing protein n=1 Tax=Ceratopteris richardii TaxID=49495 RepID=A0A8T2SS21_CERRI|nr:hypothetical protein KP509_18G028900 [Ceratopteris richardii]
MASEGDDNAAGSLLRRRKVLVAVDEGDESMHALSWALDNLIVPGQAVGAEHCSTSDLIVLLHVQTHPQVIVGPAGPGKHSWPHFFVPLLILKNVSTTTLLTLTRTRDRCTGEEFPLGPNLSLVICDL